MSNYATDKMKDSTATPTLEVAIKRVSRWTAIKRFPGLFWKHYRLARYCTTSRYHSARLAFKFTVISLFR